MGPVALAAAIFAFMVLKGRDTMLSTWETFSRKRFERGREEGVEQGVEIGIERGRAEGREGREALAKRIAELEKRVQELTSSNGTSC
jgi:flagellar biosynthesis/type III secretory pathway protein FliH